MWLDFYTLWIFPTYEKAIAPHFEKMKGNLNMRGQGIILCIKILNILMQSSTITKSHQILDAYAHHLGFLLVYLCLLLLYMQMILCLQSREGEDTAH